MQDALLVNKVAAAILTAALIAMTAAFVAGFIYHPKELAENAYVIEVTESSASGAVAEAPVGPEPIAALLAAASVDAGKKVAKKCGACHKFEKDGKHGTGPALWNIVNADKGAAAGFTKYSSGMKEFEGNWTYDALNHFLYNPKKYIADTKMNFKGLKKTKDRANLVAYLRSLSDSPAPLP